MAEEGGRMLEYSYLDRSQDRDQKEEGSKRQTYLEIKQNIKKIQLTLHLNYTLFLTKLSNPSLDALIGIIY